MYSLITIGHHADNIKKTNKKTLDDPNNFHSHSKLANFVKSKALRNSV